jgi:DNA modification methylase
MIIYVHTKVIGIESASEYFEMAKNSIEILNTDSKLIL